MKLILEKIIKWVTNSGLEVNNGKSEICLSYHKDTLPVTLTINGFEIATKNSMNVLGVHFEDKLNWQTHIQIEITKSKKPFRQSE